MTLKNTNFLVFFSFETIQHLLIRQANKTYLLWHRQALNHAFRLKNYGKIVSMITSRFPKKHDYRNGQWFH